MKTFASTSFCFQMLVCSVYIWSLAFRPLKCILYVFCFELRFKSCSPKFLRCHFNSVTEDATLCRNMVSAGASSQVYMVYI